MTAAALLLRLATIDYETAWSWQRETAATVRAGGDEVLALLQHRPVYSFGRRVRPEHLLVDIETLGLRGAAVVESDRGGDITFHGPGQIVGYPIIELRRHRLSPGSYIRALEETMIQALELFGLAGERVPGRPGVWIEGAKVGAVGVRVQGGVTTHGFALNVAPDLAWFDAIVPCGIAGVQVTSIEQILGIDPGLRPVEDAIANAFAKVFDLELVTAASQLGREKVLTHGR